MTNNIVSAFFLIFLLGVNIFAQAQPFYQTLAGRWSGTLEYLDYSDGKSLIKLRTELEVKIAPDGNSAEFIYTYDDFGKVIKDTETSRIDWGELKFYFGKNQYAITSSSPGKLILNGSGQDGEKIEPVRQTINFSKEYLNILKETRSPWQFRHEYKLTRDPIYADQRSLSTAEMKEDLFILKKALITLHPGIYRYNTPRQIEKLFSDLNTRITMPLNEGEFFRLIAQMTAKLGCGHTFPNPLNQTKALQQSLFNRRTFFPFYFKLIGGKMIVTENASSKKLAKGSEILSINGVPAGKIVEVLSSVAKADGLNTPEHRLNNLELDRSNASGYTDFDIYFPLFFPLTDGIYTVEAVDSSTNKTTRFQVLAMRKQDRTAEMERLYGKTPSYDDGWKFEIRPDSTAVMKISNSITWRLETIDFKKFIADAFAEMKRRKTKHLIIDLRGNGGGDSDIGFELARHLASKELPPYIQTRRLIRNTEPQPELLKYIDTYDEKMKTILREGVPGKMYKKAGGGYFEFIPDEKFETYPAVSPVENNFNGKTYVIADSSNASATFQFLEFIQTNKLAVIIGQTTGGNKQGINGGNYFFLKLPNSYFEIDIPVFFQAPLTKQTDSGIVPDFPVVRKSEDAANSFDPEMAAAQKLILLRK